MEGGNIFEPINPPCYQPCNSPTPYDILMFKQHKDELLYDAWARFKYLLQKVPHHNFDLWSLTQVFYNHVDQQAQWDIYHIAGRDLRDLNAEKAWEAIENCAQYYYLVDNPTNIDISQLTANLKDHETSLFGDEYVSVEIPKWMSCNAIVQNEHIGNLDINEGRVENLSPLSTPQVLPSFEAHTSPMTYPEEVEETIGTPIEVEPLNQTQLEDTGLNAFSDHNLTLSFMEVPSFDELEPQPKPLPNLPSLDVKLGIEKGPDPPIKPYSPGSITLEVVDSRPCGVGANVGVNHDLTYLHHPFMIDHKKHYGFKPGLLGTDRFPTRSLSKLLENDPFLGENFNSPIDQSELGKVMMIEFHIFEHIIHPPLSLHMAYFHRDGVYRYFHPLLILSVGKTSLIYVK